MSTEFGPFSFDKSSGKLTKHGIPIRVRGMPLKILQQLLEQPGEIVSRKELQKLLWNGTAFGDFEQGLNSAVNVVRKTLNDSAEQARYIETVPGEGYRFVAPVRYVSPRDMKVDSNPSTELSSEDTSETIKEASETPAARLDAKTRPKYSRWIMAAAFGLIALLAAGLWSTHRTKPKLSYGVTASTNRLANDQYELAMNFLTVQNDLPAARRTFKRALEMDPNFSAARLQYALAIVIEILNGHANEESRLYEAEEELHRAERVTPASDGLLQVTQAGVYLAEGRLDLVPFTRIVNEWRRSKYRTNPVWPVILLMLRGQTEEPLGALRTWLTDKPLENPPRMFLGELLRTRGNTAEAIVTLQRALEQAPSNMTAAWFLTMAYLDEEKPEMARSLLDKMRTEFEKNYMWRHGWAIALAAQGEQDAARKAMDEDTLKFARLTWSVTSATADFYALTGDRVKAIQWLQLAISRGDERISYFRRNPRLATLQSDPRFQSLLRSVEARYR